MSLFLVDRPHTVIFADRSPLSICLGLGTFTFLTICIELHRPHGYHVFLFARTLPPSILTFQVLPSQYVHFTHISTMREAKIKEFYERDTKPRWNRYGAMAVSHASETKDSHSRRC